MTKYSSKPDSENKGRSDRSRNDKPGRKRSTDSSSDKKKDGYKAKRSFSKNKVFRTIKEERPSRPRRSFGSDDKKPFKRDFSKDRPDSKTDTGKRPFKRDFDKDSKRPERPRDDRPREERPRRDFKSTDDRKPFREERSKDGFKKDRPERSPRDGAERKPFKKDFLKEDKFAGFKKGSGFAKSAPARDGAADGKKRRFSKPRKNEAEEDTRRVKYDDFEEGRAFTKRDSEDKKPVRKVPTVKTHADDGLTRLNKYLSNAGIASRRDADNLILSGVVKVNGVVIDQLGYKIKAGDKVTYGDAAVKSERKVYMLLNKPKDYITTVDDPRERKTVMELISGACKERVYPVGRLDRNTTGLLLFTNDGELTTKLTHPKFGVKKVYHVTLNKGLKPDDFKAIIDGIELEDGIVKVDDVAFVGEGKKDVGIEIHSGRNRIVRRIFEHLGYDVIKLDRVVFAGLTKKDLPRGKHRFLTAKEISFLQMIG